MRRFGVAMQLRVSGSGASQFPPEHYRTLASVGYGLNVGNPHFAIFINIELGEAFADVTKRRSFAFVHPRAFATCPAYYKVLAMFLEKLKTMFVASCKNEVLTILAGIEYHIAVLLVALMGGIFYNAAELAGERQNRA